MKIIPDNALKWRMTIIITTVLSTIGLFIIAQSALANSCVSDANQTECYNVFLPLTLNGKSEIETTLSINHFTASVQQLGGGKDTITFDWDVSHSTYVTISIKQYAYTNPEAQSTWSVSEQGSLLVTEEPYPDQTGMTAVLTTVNDEDQLTSEIEIALSCPFELFFRESTASNGRCPNEPLIDYIVYQPFEHGIMLWARDVIFVLPLENDVIAPRQIQDTWEEGDMVSDTTIEPPDGLLQPMRGFGQVWRDDQAIRDGMGWATESEQGYDATVQSTSSLDERDYTYYYSLQDTDQILSISITLRGNYIGWSIFTP